MIDPELALRLEVLEAKVDKAYHASETVRTYLFWTGVVTIILIVVPAIGLAFAIPSFIGNYTSTLNSLGY